ncbi:MAG: hypothetical protein KJ066_02700 [Acidobacteria bacterium]|nr:hypothetical protein [Acidobacteriota bacterium]
MGVGAPLVVALVALSTVGTLAWLAVRALAQPPGTPDRIVAELRLSQLASLVLAFTAAGYLGLAAARADAPGAALDAALTLVFLGVAVVASLRDPHEALTWLALGFLVHVGVDLLHGPELLLSGVAPRWYVVGCALHNGIAGALCYLPLLRR